MCQNCDPAPGPAQKTTAPEEANCSGRVCQDARNDPVRAKQSPDSKQTESDTSNATIS